MGGGLIRRATAQDMSGCAAILNNWIDVTEWMPRVHAHEDVDGHYRNFVFAKRNVWVTGDPVAGYLSWDAKASEITALYAARPGQGIGKALLDHMKSEQPALSLWTFVANQGARRFYVREGFREVARTDGDNEEQLPDVRFEWSRPVIRRADLADAKVCARIVSDWIDRTEWMPRVVSEAQMAEMIAEALPQREIWLIGEPAEGYLSVNPETGQIGALYLDRPGLGLGKALLDRAKKGRTYLQLWTHEPNTAAHRFYAREGFEVVERNPQGGDGLSELRMEWRR